ncbi:MAG TPA: hypothetical protein VJ276_14735 [Thermoanaerobaculia bacterium]|nr:hypothetical protein [Thermoanaerobaculia bacterium]
MRAVIVVVSIVILVLAGLWVAGIVRQNRVASDAWPAGLGTLHDVPRRFPKAAATPAAEELTRLAAPLEIDLRAPRERTPKVDAVREPLTAYLKSQLERTDASIAPAPEPVASYLAAHGEQLAAVRRHLVSGAPIAWPVDLAQEHPPMPSLVAHMQLFRLLTADALDRASRGELVAWDDLEASWRLARSLLARPEQISQLVGLAGVRQTNAAARKMPLPAPYWLAEMASFDVRQSYLQSMQAETWTVWRSGERFGILGPLQTNLIGERRALTGRLAAEQRCAFDGASFVSTGWNRLQRMEIPNLQSAWERLFRTRAELELTAHAVAARSGAPPNPRSACADGQWLYESRADGGTAIRFSKPLPEPKDRRVIHYPAEFVVTPAPAKPRST